MRKAFKAVAWIVGGLIGLVVLVYVVALAVNWQDQPPSAEALRLAASYDARPSLADDDNAFIYLLGFDGPLSDDPGDVGARRLAWLKAAPFDGKADPQTTRLEYGSADPVVERFLMACETDSRECAIAFADSRAAFEAWNRTHPWLLERYRTFISHSGWREEIVDVAAPLPGYASAMHGQRLLLLQAKVLADSGDSDAASELLARDARFWRMVLAESDLLITKMIATVALQRHFAWGSLAMRSFPPDRVAASVPSEWRRPLTEAELSMRRTLAGEWIFFSNMSTRAYAGLDNEETLLARASNRLLLPFFQKQDTFNRHARYLSAVAETLEAPLEGYAGVADRASELTWQTADEALSLYNFVGTLVISTDPADYAPYARRVADLEGTRRAAVATVTLHGAATPNSDLAAELSASSLRSPYDGQPLRWDAEEKAVVFIGLEPGERGEHRFYY